MPPYFKLQKEAIIVIGQDAKNESNNTQVGQTNTFKRNIGPCYECGNYGHLSRECPLKLVNEKVAALDKVVGKITTTLEAETPIHFKDVNDIVNRALRKEKSKILQKKISMKINQKLNQPPLDSKTVSQVPQVSPVGRGRGRGISQGQQNAPQPGNVRKQEQLVAAVGKGRGRGVTKSKTKTNPTPKTAQKEETPQPIVIQPDDINSTNDGHLPVIAQLAELEGEDTDDVLEELTVKELQALQEDIEEGYSQGRRC